MKSSVLGFCFIFFFFLCPAQQTELPLKGEHYVINLDAKRKKTTIPFSYIFKNVKTIILETSNDCFIGRIDELQVFDGYIYVLDQNIAKSLFVFDMEGHFIRKIGGLGKGPGEYIQPTDFTLDIENRFIYLLDRSNRVHKYQFDGTYINTITAMIRSANISFIQYYKGRLYADATGWTPNKIDYLLFEIDPKNGKIIKQSIPRSYNKGWNESFFTGHNFFMSRLNSPPRYTQLFMNYIVSVGEEPLPYIELKSKDMMTSQDVENLQGDMLQIHRAIHKRARVSDVHSFIENDHFIFFYYWYEMSICPVLFNKRNKSTELVQSFDNDFLYKKDEFITTFVFSDAHGAYEVPDEYWLPEFQQLVKKNEVVPGLDKVDQLMKLDEESNPVIFYYEYKDAE